MQEGVPDLEKVVEKVIAFGDHFLVHLKIKSKYCTNGSGPSNHGSRTRKSEMPTYACPISQNPLFKRFATIFGPNFVNTGLWD